MTSRIFYKKNELKRWSFLVAAALIIIGITVNGNAAQEIKIALITGLTGGGAPWGTRAWNTTQLLLDEINTRGGVKSMGGAKIKVVVMDHQSKPNVAGINAEKLVNEGVAAIIGCNSSGAAMVVSQICERAKIPYIDNNDHEPALTERGFKYIFRVCPSGDQLADGTLEFAKWLTKKKGFVPQKVGILNAQAAAPYATFKLWEKSVPEAFNVVFKETYPETQQNFAGIVSKMKQLGVDFVFQMSWPADALLVTRAFKELDFNPMGFLADDSAHDGLDFIENLGKDANYYFVTCPYTPDIKLPVLDELKTKYKNRFNMEFDRADALQANALSVLIDALERSGSDKPEKLHNALKTTDLKVGQYWYVVPDGCKFNEKGQNIKQQLMTFQIIDGKWKTVYPESWATTSAVFPIPKWGER